ncbi:hypothetical protein GGI07_002652 [Coemansia sp. Benny D115]|nr:hypothetical protein GGI07_002652 [Coemansia sp. Benny D115]
MEDNTPTQQQQQQQQEPSLQQLGLFNMDLGDDPSAAAAGAGGNFLFPLTDQTSLFNFHTPAGLGLDFLYTNPAAGFTNSAGLDFSAQLPSSAGGPNAARADSLAAMDIGSTSNAARADSLPFGAPSSSLIFGQSMAAVASPTSVTFPAPPADVSSAQDALQPSGTVPPQTSQMITSPAEASQDPQSQMAARVRIARAQILNNMLYSMGMGGMQNLDGIRMGTTINGPLDGLEDSSGMSSYVGMNRFLADAATANALGMPVPPRPANFQNLPVGFTTPGSIPNYPMASAISPSSALFADGTSGVSANNALSDIAASASAANAQPTGSSTRIDQACKMCRRRKVRCNGLRPSCSFCISKGFECVYEPVAPGNRKRGCRSKASDSGSVLSSNAGSMSAADYNAGWRRDIRGGQRLPSIRSESSFNDGDYGRDRNSVADTFSEADDEHGYRRRHAKQQRRFGGRGEGLEDIPDGMEFSDIDSGESSSSEGAAENGYLKALSNRQIALPANVGPGFSIQDIINSQADIELAESVAAAALASIASDPRNSSNADKTKEDADKAAKAHSASVKDADNSAPAPAPVPAPAPGAAGGAVKSSSAKGASASTASGRPQQTTSLAERHIQLYFTFFHPQHPILHRQTFEKSVRDGTVNKVLWHAVQAIAARYGAAPKTSVPEAAAGADKTTAATGATDSASTDRMAVDSPMGTPTSETFSDVSGSSEYKEARRRLRPYEYGRPYARLVRAMLPEATRTPSIEVIQALYLLSEHQFGMGDWLEGSTYWGTAVRMFNQLQLHMADEAFQFPAYTSHLGLHESAISPLTCRQSPANYASEMRKPTLNNETWIKRELERRMRWVLFESERMHTLAGGTPPLVTLEAGWVHMPCSDAIWEMPNPRRAAEYERLLLHMGRYYVDTGGSLRIDIPAGPSAAPSPSITRVHSMQDNCDDAQQGTAAGAGGVPGVSATAPGDPKVLPLPQLSAGMSQMRRKQHVAPMPNRVASMLVSVRRRMNRIHLKAHTAIVIGQMTRARLALFRLFFPCRWPSQLMSNNLFGMGHEENADLGGGGGAPGPVVLSWDERFRRMRITIADIEAKLIQWRVYLESMFPLREHEEGSGRSDEENQAIHRERVEYANYRFMLAALIIQNRSTVLQLQACLARRERKIRCASLETDELGETARQTLANHILPNQPGEQAMRALRAYGQECWTIIVRQACEIEDLLESHWQVRPHTNPNLRVLIKPDWHSSNAIKAKINAETNARRYPEDKASGQRNVDSNVKIFFSHETPPYPLLVNNHRLLEAVVKSANTTEKQAGAELTLASSMNSNIHIETNANARDMGQQMMDIDSDSIQQQRQRQQNAKQCDSLLGSNAGTAAGGEAKKSTTGRRRRLPRINMTSAGEVDFESSDEAEAEGMDGEMDMDPFRMQLAGTSYFVFLAAKTMIMYLHHAKMSAYILARRKNTGGTSENGDGILPSSSVSVDNESSEYLNGVGGDAMLVPDFVEDLSPAPQLRTLTDIRRMQDRLEIVMTALRSSQKYWMGVDYYVLCARKLRNMSVYGPWRNEDPVSTDISAELANEPWVAHEQMAKGFSGNMTFST